MAYHHHHLRTTAATHRRWHSLVELTGLLLDGKVRLEELSANDDEPRRRPTTTTFDLHFSKRGKRSPRRNSIGAWIKAAGTLMNNGNPNVAVPCRPKKIKKRPPGRRRFAVSDHVAIPGYPGVGPAPPEKIKNRILELGGCLESVCFLIEKGLYPTDLRKDESRLSVPCRQVRNRFLEAEEMERLETVRGFEAILIQPSLEECRLRFSYWPSNTTYALHEGWNHVWSRNELVENMVVRLWSFRRGSELCFALMKMDG